MELENTPLEGLMIIHNFQAHDDRGSFVKTFHKDLFKDGKIDFNPAESYFSRSRMNVIRGMHFQNPPNDHQKLVYVPVGRILDVVVDLRSQSKTYKKWFAVELSEENKKSIFIPKGFAHGFLSMSENTVTVYNVSSVYEMSSDNGINFNSFGFDWGVQNPIISERDKNFMSMEDFCIHNPF